MNTVVRFCCCKKSGRKSIFRSSPFCFSTDPPRPRSSPLPHRSAARRSMPCLQIEPNFLPLNAIERGSDLPVRASPTATDRTPSLRWVQASRESPQCRPGISPNLGPETNLLLCNSARSVAPFPFPSLPTLVCQEQCRSCPQCNPPRVLLLEGGE